MRRVARAAAKGGRSHHVSKEKLKNGEGPVKVSRWPRMVLLFLVGIVVVVIGTSLSPSILVGQQPQQHQEFQHQGDSPNTRATPSTRPSPPRRKWAYVFLLGGIDPINHPEQYIGMLYNIIVATYNLRHDVPLHPSQSNSTTSTRSTSKADVIVLVQISIHATQVSELPKEQILLLDAMNIQIHYVQSLDEGRRQSVQNFYTVTLEKFRILQLVEYSRVMFLDTDVMPFCSLDYLFELSEPDTNTDIEMIEPGSEQEVSFKFEENVILAWRNSPAHAGIFILNPYVGTWEQIQQIIERREVEALQLPWPHFNATIGWGHVIETSNGENGDHVRILHPPRRRKGGGSSATADDTTTTTSNKFYPWEWYCAYSDQGLLYYWTKYVQQKVSIIIGEEVEIWTRNDDDPKKATTNVGSPKLQQVWTNHPLSSYSCLPNGMHKRGYYGYTGAVFSRHSVPYIDIAHFTSDYKPWELSYAGTLLESIQQRFLQGDKEDDFVVKNIHNATEYWFYILGVILKNEPYYKNQRLVQNVNQIINTTQNQHAPVGRAVGYRQMILAAKARRRQSKERKQKVNV